MEPCRSITPLIRPPRYYELSFCSIPQSTVRKKMAAVHFTTIPCEPNRAISTHRKLYFGEIHPCSNKIVYAKFDVFSVKKTFSVRFYEWFYDFRALRIIGKCTSHHLFSYGGLKILSFPYFTTSLIRTPR